MIKPFITKNQRKAQAKMMIIAGQVLKLAIQETKTATPKEIIESIDTVLDNLNTRKAFLETRQ